jgi:hypothetical protein
MHEPDFQNTRLARLGELERRYDGPIPESALRALSFPSERAERISDARREMAVFRELIVCTRRAARDRRERAAERTTEAARADLRIYFACWRARRRRLAKLLPNACAHR